MTEPPSPLRMLLSRHTKRREFITLLGGAAAAWPLAARAQQRERMRRVGVLMNIAADDADAPVRVAAFAQGLQELGWTIGRNLRIEYRWSAGEADRIRRYAAEISALSPDVIIASGGAHAAAVQQAARTVPIVFLSVNDPVAAGLVASLARPGGTATGFTALEFGTGAKWLELLKQIAPGVTRGGGPSSGEYRRGRPVGRNSGRGGVARGGGEPGRPARRRRDRARRHRLRARAEWRPDRGGERIGPRSSRR